jgi:hypothetical protein
MYLGQVTEVICRIVMKWTGEESLIILRVCVSMTCFDLRFRTAAIEYPRESCVDRNSTHSVSCQVPVIMIFCLSYRAEPACGAIQPLPSFERYTSRVERCSITNNTLTYRLGLRYNSYLTFRCYREFRRMFYFRFEKEIPRSFSFFV